MELTQWDLNRLKQLAEQATPGPWVKRGSGWHQTVMSLPTIGNPAYELATSCRGYDVSYIAAVSPDVVMALIAEIERLRKETGYGAE